MSFSRIKSPSIAISLSLLGALVSWWLFNIESRAVAESLLGRELEASQLHHWRPWALALLPLLPALGAGLYLLGDPIDRYFGRLFLKAFLATLSTLSAIWLLGDLQDHMSDFGNSEQGLQVALRYYASQFPAVMVLILPYSLLISLLFLLGKLSKSCEIISVLQCGRSLPRLAAPFLTVGLLASMACLVFNFHWAPQAQRYQDGILSGARIGEDGRAGLNKVVYNNEAKLRIWTVGFLPNTNAAGLPLEEVKVESFSAPGVLASVISAPIARFDPSSSLWTFEKGRRIDYTQATPVITRLPEKFIITEFNETPWQFLNPTLQPDQRGMPSLDERLSSQELGQAERRRLLTQRYLRIGNALICLVIVSIAIPLGIVFTRRGTATGVATAIFLAAAMIFSSQVIPSFSEAGYLPPFLGGFGTVILFGFAAYLLIHRRIKGQAIYAQLRKVIGLRT